MTTDFRSEAPRVELDDLEPLVAADIALPGLEPAPEAAEPEGNPEAVEDVSRFVLEHRGSGITRIMADGLALAVAAVEAAVLQGAVHTVHVHGVVTIAFSTMILRLFASVPVMVAVLGASHARLHVRRSLGAQVAGLAPFLAIGGLLSMLGWHIAQGVGAVVAPPDDAILLMSAFGLVTVTAARMAYEAPPIDELGTRTRRLLVVGSGVVADRLMETLPAEGGVTVVGFVDDDPKDPTGCLGKLAELGDLCERLGVDHVIVAFTRSASEDIIEALRPIQGRLPITVVPRLFDVLPVTANLHELGSGITGIGLPTAALGSVPRVLKRSMDVLGAGAALLLLSPVLAVVALCIRLTSKGPVLYRQDRVGHRGESFEVLKFRSMYVAQESDDPSQLSGEAVKGPFPKLKDDPRVTSVGRFIRRTSVDELPQLWNVVRGNMSLVGPRPFIPRDAAFISGWHQRRYSVRPGITGLWQVSGRNNLTFEEMCPLDSLYVTSWSVGLDLRILLRTLRAVLTSRGAF